MVMIVGALTFPSASWWWVALAAAVVLVPLAWLAVGPAWRARDARTMAVALALRTLGVGLLLVCLLDPQWTARRAVRGANQFAVVADNSQGLQISDPGSDMTRGQWLREQLAGSDNAWLGELADEFQVRPYVFDRELRRVRDFSSLDFSGDRSALGAALQRLRETRGRAPLAGVLLFTDGNATDLPTGVPDLAGLPPIYPVVVGTGGVHDVRLEAAIVRQTAFDDAPLTVEAQVAGTGIGRERVRVSVQPLPNDSAAPKPDGSLPPAQNVRLRADGQAVLARFTWRPSGSGIQFFAVQVDAPSVAESDEATRLNDRRIVMVDRGRAAYRVLYVGGRPSWDFKFLNRALSEDPQLQMVGLLRVARREPKFEFKGRPGEASNPMYRGFGSSAGEAPRYDQPVLVRVNARDEKELRAGFPQTAEELFAYEAVILDDVEAAFFTPDQLSLLRRFVSDRGGGLIMLGGADSLEDGGFAETPLASALPIYLDRKPPAPPQGALTWSLTREGWVEPWMRVRPVESDERARLQAMPEFQVGNALSGVKPGATVLAQFEDEEGRHFPALVEQPFGAGRVAAIAIGDLWRWGLSGPEQQADLARFWRQVARWLVTEVPAQVELRVQPAEGTPGVRLRVKARDAAFRPVDLASARLTIRRIRTLDAQAGAAGEAGFTAVTLPAEPLADAPGEFAATFAGRDAGAYRAEVEVTDEKGKVLGRAEAGWVIDPAGDEFRSLEPNRELLAEIARQTGGEVIAPADLARFVGELPMRGAPIEEAWAYPVWNTAWVFLAVLACFLAEWLWRRWRGLP